MEGRIPPLRLFEAAISAERRGVLPVLFVSLKWELGCAGRGESLLLRNGRWWVEDQGRTCSLFEMAGRNAGRGGEPLLLMAG